MGGGTPNLEEGTGRSLGTFPLSSLLLLGAGERKKKGQVDIKVNSTFVARIQNS